jgi:hypothetical protein
MTAVDASERELRLKTFESRFGRRFGWYVELDGRQIAELTDPQSEDMFWVNYAVTPLADDESTREALFTDAFWKRTDLVYRNRFTGEVPPKAFQGGPPPSKERPRVSMRALYSSLTPTRYERLLLWFRRRRRRSQPSVVP